MLEMIIGHSEEFCDIIDESKKRDAMFEASNAIADTLTTATFEAKDAFEGSNRMRNFEAYITLLTR